MCVIYSPCSATRLMSFTRWLSLASLFSSSTDSSSLVQTDHVTWILTSDRSTTMLLVNIYTFIPCNDNFISPQNIIKRALPPLSVSDFVHIVGYCPASAPLAPLTRWWPHISQLGLICFNHCPHIVHLALPIRCGDVPTTKYFAFWSDFMRFLVEEENWISLNVFENFSGSIKFILLISICLVKNKFYWKVWGLKLIEKNNFGN